MVVVVRESKREKERERKRERTREAGQRDRETERVGGVRGVHIHGVFECEAHSERACRAYE